MRPRRFIAFMLSLLLIGVSASAAFAQGEATAEPTEADLAQAQTTATPRPAQTATATSQPTAAPTAAQEYRVQPGDNLFRIAIRFQTTTRALAEANNITNVNLIYSGQVLRIPGAVANPPTPQPDPAPTATPTATAAPPAAEESYVVQRGDTLRRIAARFDTTVAALVSANNIVNPNIIFVGQRLTIPAPGAAPALVTDSTTSADPAELTAPVNPGFGYGLEVFFFNQDIPALMTEIETLGVAWVKVRVDWRALEPVEGEIAFEELDEIVEALDNAEIEILFTVVNAPNWSRTAVDENGPPDDLATFGTFVGTLAERYAGRVDAYEIWDEPNLRRNWRCDANGNPAICSTDYVDLITVAYQAIKAADSAAVVVTAGLAPTGFNDGINAINDQLYLRTLFANGIANVSDAIGAHPGGWANPPDARCCTQSTGVETHYEDASFYFLENLTAYRTIMVQANDAATPLWVTKFGWGSSEDGQAPSANNVFYSYTSLSEQAIYAPRGFEIGEASGYVGPMFLDNLNGCQGLPSRVEVCYTALLSPEGDARPVFEAVAALDIPEAPAPERPLPPMPEGEATPEATPGS